LKPTCLDPEVVDLAPSNQALERCAPTSAIPGWCDLPEEVQATIKAMIAASEILPDELERRVSWDGHMRAWDA